MCAAHRPVCQYRCPKVFGLLCGCKGTVAFPPRGHGGSSAQCCSPPAGDGDSLSVHPSLVTKWPHHRQLSHTMVAYCQLLCQRAVVTSPHETFTSPLLLLLFCLPLSQLRALLFNHPSPCTSPPQVLPAEVSPGSSCLLPLASPLNLSPHGVV